MFRKKPRHKHSWRRIHSTLFTRSYVRQPIFRKSSQLDIECIAKLFKCSECGEEKATVWSDYLKNENHMGVYMADSWGDIDPLYYHLKFMKSGKSE